MTKANEFLPILRLSPWFGNLESGAIERIAALCTSAKLLKNEVLFRKGDPGDALYGLRRGAIRIETGATDGTRLTLNMLGAGDIFGELAVFDGEARTADAVAVENSEVYLIRRPDLLRFLEKNPSVTIQLLALLCGRMRWMSERMEEVSLEPVPQRIAKRLVGLAEDFGDEIKITQSELAEFVSAVRETVSRQLLALQKQKIIKLHRGYITVLDRGKLASVALARSRT